MMENYILAAVLVVIIGLAAWYVYKAKKSGKTCIGCPNSDACSAKKNGCCSCEQSKDD